MARCPDLTGYSYLETDDPMVNVGWLGAGADFERGAVPVGVVEALLVLAADQKNVMRGVHPCEFCDEASPIRLRAAVPDGWVGLGMGELRRAGTVVGDPLHHRARLLSAEGLPGRSLDDARCRGSGRPAADGGSPMRPHGRPGD